MDGPLAIHLDVRCLDVEDSWVTTTSGGRVAAGNDVLCVDNVFPTLIQKYPDLLTG